MAETIVIAVDFGTTYSAVGYSKYILGTDPRDVTLHIVENGWPGQGGRRATKIPTVFKIERDKFKYGFEVEYDDDRVAFSKLFLDPFQVQSAEELGRCTNTEVVRNDTRLLDGVSRFLEALRLKALHHMVASSGWTQDFVNATPKEYVLSVPAIWSDRARDKTLSCAYKAGFGQRFSPSAIKLVTEPEAAASYTITTQPIQSFQKGSVFIVCDAGGGTVDLSAYEITRPIPNLELRELTISEGALWGSVYLDQAFLAYVEDKVGKLPVEVRNTILTEFKEEIKPAFTGEEDNTIYVDSDLPDDADVGFENGTLVVPNEDLKAIFDGVIVRILILLSSQIDRVKETMKNIDKVTIILVGGFGSSAYLKHLINEMFSNVDVIQPPDSWSAVIRGALMKNMIQTRKIRCAYGVVFEKPWKRDLDVKGEEFTKQHKIWDRVEQKWYCTDCMRWYVKKGDEFSESKTVIFSYYRAVGLGHSMKFTDYLYVYRARVDGDVGPKYLDLQCERYQKLNADLAAMVPDIKSRLQAAGMKKSNARGSYYEVHYDIGMTFDNEIKFYLMFEGQKVQIEAEYVEPLSRPGAIK